MGVGTSHGHLDTLDSPRPGFGGSHHLPPYNILCSFTQRLHPNDFFSRDSQGGVPKLSRFGLLGLWASITSRPELGSGRGFNQSCSSCRELFNAMPHSRCSHREKVDSRLLVVGSQIASLTPGLSFAHNLGCRCPNGSCEAILDIYTSRPFQWHKEHSNAGRFDPWTRALSFRESRKTPTSHFWECGLHPHTYPKVGLRQFASTISKSIIFILTHSCIAKLVNNTTNVYKHHKVHRIHYEFIKLFESICFAYNWPKVHNGFQLFKQFRIHINLAWFPHRTKFP